MNGVDLVLVMVGLGASLLLSVAVMTLQQAEHRKAGLLPGPDPRTKTESLLDAVLGAVPIQQVRHGSVAFEDGSGIMFADADRKALDELSRLSAACEVFLEKVHELTLGWRLVFRGGDTQAYVDVGAWQVVAPTTIPT